LAASGLPSDAFLYLGYLPRKAGERRGAIQAAANQPYTLIFLETPHRLLEALADLQAVLGDRPCAVARELTKLHEEIVRGPLSQAIEHFTANRPRGEFTLVVGGQINAPKTWDADMLRRAVLERLENGAAPSHLAAELADESGWARRTIYQLILEITKE
jgi:16S rRNA (cytidine1402-2'-O)-methyltransferase